MDCQSDLRCGNGQVDPEEVCDDGTEPFGNRCSADCKTSLVCQTAPGQTVAELCDDGFECTVGVCDPQLGCLQTPDVDGTSCAGNEGSCRSGGCVVEKTVVGLDTACHLDALGQITCWGSNSVLVDNVPPGVWVDLDLEDTRVCALDVHGQPVCWGTAAWTNLPSVTWDTIALTQYQLCGIDRTDGLVQCLGSDNFGVVSNANTTEPFVELVATQGSVCGIKAVDGSIDCWGLSSHIAGMPSTGVYEAIRGTADTYCAQADDGLWTCFGLDQFGETQVPAGEDFVDVAVGWHSVCGLRADNKTVTCWGVGTVTPDANDNYGQTTPPSGADDLFETIVGGWQSVCGVRVDGDGRFECWGRYTDNDPRGTDTSLEPPEDCGNQKVDLGEVCDPSVDGSGPCSVDCQSDLRCGNGQVDPEEVCDGGPNNLDPNCTPACELADPCELEPGQTIAQLCNDFNECTVDDCDPSSGCFYTPVADGQFCGIDPSGSCFSGVCVVPDLAVGTDTACAITVDGEIVCWGLNADLINNAPTGVWADLDMQTTFACAIDGQSLPTCWGTNAPAIVAPTPIVGMAASSDAVCGVVPGEFTVKCWGNDEFSQVTWPGANLVDPVVALTAAEDSFCALNGDRSVTCWGELVEIGLTGPGGGGVDFPGSFFAPFSGTTSHCFRDDNAGGAWVCWGADPNLASGAPTFFDALAFGEAHGCASSEGRFCWGAGGPTDPTGTAPHFGQGIPINTPYDVMSAGPFSTCGLSIFSETVNCWGLGTSNDGDPLTTYLEPPPGVIAP